MRLLVEERCENHNPPDIEDIEVSMFGAGFGECLCVHLPGGMWILVDSCRGLSGQPASLEYLEELGIDVETSVSLVVASHWHIDHVQGFTELVEVCRSAEPVMSGALHSMELLTYAGASQYLGTSVPHAIEELTRTLKLISEQETRFITPAQARMRLLEYRFGSVYSSVTALSPSPASVAAAISDLAWARLEPGVVIRTPRPDHNSAAVVLGVRAGDTAVLLASDLENHPDRSRGWRAVVDINGLSSRMNAVKVAHHGSENADSGVVWDELLVANPIGMLTHFHRGSVHLPEGSQLAKIASRCGALYSTSGPSWTPAVMPAGEAARRLAKGRSIGWRSPGLGHVRLRARPCGPEQGWRVSLCGPAAGVT